jgi:hypothetical protein
MARTKKIKTNIEPKEETKEEPKEETKEEPKEEVIGLENQNNECNLQIINKSKRGRKPKNLSLINNNNVNTSNINTKENIVLYSSDDKSKDCCGEEKQIILEIKDDMNVIENLQNSMDEKGVPSKPVGKKRGRKPKGGKIIQQILPSNNIKESKPNVILHLKCSMKDLQNNVFENNINGYDFSSCKKELLYEIITNNENNYNNSINLNLLNTSTEENITNDFYNDDSHDIDSSCTFNNKKNDLKELWKKLKNLEYSLHLNNISDKKSACFWCTYEFDNPPIYIPKHYIKDSYHVYGCFCSPECATAFLMEENIDSSTKFERYHLLNHIYSKIYDYTKNIKPAPNPYYILEKFYGNLNIQEYRSLLKNERLFLVVDKPLTRILPELHEDNDDFIINNKVIPSNTYQIKRKILSKQSKNNILSEKFGLH